MVQNEANKRDRSIRNTFKTVGWAAFLFFLIKGLLWLIVPALVAYYAVSD